MRNYKVGLAGIGKLGTAMMNHWNQNNIKIGVYHPEQTKAADFVKKFRNCYQLEESALNDLDLLILALPANAIIPFITGLSKPDNTAHSPCFINMATTLNTNEITKVFPSLNIYGLRGIWGMQGTYWNTQMVFLLQKP